MTTTNDNEPSIEAEPEWVVRVAVPEQPTAAQLAALRAAHTPYQGLGVAALRDELARTSLVWLGPYFPPRVAEEHQMQLLLAGLVAEVVAR